VEQAWPHRSFWAEKNLYIERVVPLLITGGVFIHLVRIGAYLRDREARVSDVLQPVVDAPLTLLMIYCAIGLLFWRSFFRRFRITSMWRKVCYFLIAFYIIASIPGHIRFLLSGNTAYFDFFPWWFSIALMPVYVLIILYFITLPQGGIK
jgi:hypothetical protein